METTGAHDDTRAVETAEAFFDRVIGDASGDWQLEQIEQRDAQIRRDERAKVLEECAERLDELEATFSQRVMFPSAMADVEIPASDAIRALSSPEPPEDTIVTLYDPASGDAVFSFDAHTVLHASDGATEASDDR